MFNRKNLLRNIDKNICYILKSDFFNFIRDDITERLLLLGGDFNRIMIIRDHGGIVAKSLQNSKHSIKEIISIEDEEIIIDCDNRHSGEFSADEGFAGYAERRTGLYSSTSYPSASEDLSGQSSRELPFIVDFPRRFNKVSALTRYGKFGLIIFPFGLHFTNDIQGLLSSCAALLENDGLFICNFACGGSLQNLRRYLITAESKFSLAHRSYIAPLIKFDDVALLLKQAGFVESIVDMEKLELEFETPLDLMRAIKKAGCSNISSNRKTDPINKQVFSALGRKGYDMDDFIDHINLGSFIASISKHSIKFR